MGGSCLHQRPATSDYQFQVNWNPQRRFHIQSKYTDVYFQTGLRIFSLDVLQSDSPSS